MELLEARLRARLSQIGGDPFDGLGPARIHVQRVPVEPRNQIELWAVVTLDSVTGDGSPQVKNSEAERIARTESLFREVNERIAESAERFEATETKFVCECADPTCTHRVDATLEQYEQVRKDGATFLLVPGHEDERVEAVVKADDERAVVEKRHPKVAPLARKLNPRAA